MLFVWLFLKSTQEHNMEFSNLNNFNMFIYYIVWQLAREGSDQFLVPHMSTTEINYLPARDTFFFCVPIPALSNLNYCILSLKIHRYYYI